MSLDVSLYGPPEERKCRCVHCDNEHTRTDQEELFWANITHNLGKMADAAGIYEACWRPEEIGAKKAKDIIAPLKEGLEKLKVSPKRFQQFNAKNGWGLYEHFVPWVEKYLEACIAYPEAEIHVSR